MGFSDRTARGKAGTTEIGYTRLTGIAATASTIDSVYGEKNPRVKEKKKKRKRAKEQKRTSKWHRDEPFRDLNLRTSRNTK